MKKIDKLLRSEISRIILREVEIDKNIQALITSVDTANDLQYAKVLVSIIPREKTRKVIAILNNEAFNIQKELNASIKLKYIPKLEFIEDKGAVKGERIEEILNNISNN